MDRLFNTVNFSLGNLIGQIDMGVIGLPDIQRPFVWTNAKVRDLFDSMYKGFPVGYLLFWQNSFSEDVRTIGVDRPQLPPSLLIVDGQQRLTSLFAVVKGRKVVREDYSEELIEIAFNPLEEKFEVADAAIRRDRSYLPNISVLWEQNVNIVKLIQDFIANYEITRKLTDEEKVKIQNSFVKLSNLLNFPFTALQLSSDVTEEQVSEVFVRINSEGKKLNQSDFILTLMSVFWDEGRSDLEKFSRYAKIYDKEISSSPFNHIIQPSPDQMLRVAIGLGFKRARLRYVYSILRGKNLETEKFSSEYRDEQFAILKDAQSRTLNLTYWHDFLQAVKLAGYHSDKMISSQVTLLFAYTIYLIGRTEYKVDIAQLDRLIAQWLFMSNLTSRYSGSAETYMEADLKRIQECKTTEDFFHTIEVLCAEKLTEDFWTITLPQELATSSSRSPSLFAYNASLILLDAKALYSQNKIVSLLDPSIKSTKSEAEKHHLFPVNYLKKLGIVDKTQVNQIANYAYIKWNINLDISDQPPAKYVGGLISEFSPEELRKMYYHHALPEDWQNMDYQEFLIKRRERMAKVIRDGYELIKFSKEIYEDEDIDIKAIIENGEADDVEFKSTLRKNLHTGQNDAVITHSILKTITGFMNTKGGKLIVGIADDGTPVGLDQDEFENEDKVSTYLDNLLSDKVSANFGLYVTKTFEDYEDVRVLAITCRPALSPMYIKEKDREYFYVRSGNTTRELTGNQMKDFTNVRFRS